MSKRITQADRVLQYMKEFGCISRLDAMRDLGVANLTAVISEIRKSGIRIETKYFKTKNRYGEKVKFARYYIVEEINGD